MCFHAHVLFPQRISSTGDAGWQRALSHIYGRETDRHVSAVPPSSSCGAPLMGTIVTRTGSKAHNIDDSLWPECKLDAVRLSI